MKVYTLRQAIVEQNVTFLKCWLAGKYRTPFPKQLVRDLATEAYWMATSGDLGGPGGWTDGSWAMWLKKRIWSRIPSGQAKDEPDRRIAVRLNIGFVSIPESEGMLFRLRKHEKEEKWTGSTVTPARSKMFKATSTTKPIDRVAHRVGGDDPAILKAKCELRMYASEIDRYLRRLER